MTKSKGGRPTDYDQEIALTICERICNGEGVREIARDEAMPAQSTIFLWLSKHEEFSELYTKAKQEQAELMADEIIEIADNGQNDWMEKNNTESPGYIVNGEAIARSRLRVDARKWIAARLLPQKYGDFSRTELTGKGGKDLIPDRIIRDDITGDKK